MELDASGTTDPDGNALTSRWWQYYDADSAAARVTIANSTSQSGAASWYRTNGASRCTSSWRSPTTAVPKLTHYQRVIVNIQ